MSKSYILGITLIVLIGIQLYQPSSAQPSSNAAFGNSTNGTSNVTSYEIKASLTNITKSLESLEQSSNTSVVATNASLVDTSKVVDRIFDSNLPIIFIVVIFLVLAIPLIFDMYLAYRRDPGVGTGNSPRRQVQGIPGLYRSLMSFGVILLVGTVIFYLLALITLNINSPNAGVLQSLIDLLKNLGTILGTALATIIAFYFGVRGAESSTDKVIAAFSSGSGEKEAPTVQNTSPSDGATGVPVDSLIQATFSETMNTATINNKTFIVKKKSETSPEKGTVSISPDCKTATFDAQEDFSPNTTYEATVEIGAQDLAGNSLASAKHWSFTTKEDSKVEGGLTDTTKESEARGNQENVAKD